MHISFTRVTWYSQVIAIIVFVAVFILGMYIGMVKTAARTASLGGVELRDPAAPGPGEAAIDSAAYACATANQIAAIYYPGRVRIALSDGRAFYLPQTRSASGARYANSDESFVFWNKGNTAFTEERGVIAYRDCVER